MNYGSLFLGLALLIVVAFLVARPLLEQGTARERALDGGHEPGTLDELVAERERVLTALRDLDFDHATGKIVDDDYGAQRAQLVADGAAVLRQIDALRPARAAQAGRNHGDEIEQAVARLRGRTAGAPVGEDLDAAIEGAVARRRAAPGTAQAVTCPKCGASATTADRFCPKCGSTLGTVCANCGRPARPTDLFCGGCGQSLPTTAESASDRQRAGARG